MMYVRKGEGLIEINRKPFMAKALSECTKSNKDKGKHAEGLLHKGKVLIVDDEIDVVTPLQSYLSKHGYMALGCASGEEAIKELKKDAYDLLLIDLSLPEMSGIELLKVALEIDPYLIGIIITGKGTVQDAVDAMKAGAFDYLLKPFKFKLLSPILGRAMKVRQLKKSETEYRSLVGTGAVEIVELKEEIEKLKEELNRYKNLEKHYAMF